MDKIYRNLKLRRNFFRYLNNKYDIIFEDVILLPIKSQISIKSLIKANLTSFESISSLINKFIKINKDYIIEYEIVIDFFSNIITVSVEEKDNLFLCRGKIYTSNNGEILFNEFNLNFKESINKFIFPSLNNNLKEVFESNITKDISLIFDVLKT